MHNMFYLCTRTYVYERSYPIIATNEGTQVRYSISEIEYGIAISAIISCSTISLKSLFEGTSYEGT